MENYILETIICVLSPCKNIILTGKNMVLIDQEHDSNQEYFSYFVEQNFIVISRITFLT